MAITGSGSLAISLSVFVISAAFLSKGEFPLLFFYLRVWHGCVAALRDRRNRERRRCRRGEVVVLLRAGDARKLRLESQHHFLRAAVDFIRCCCRLQRCFSAVLSVIGDSVSVCVGE